MKKFALLFVIVAMAFSLGADLRAVNNNYDQWLLDTAEKNYLLLCKKGCPSVMESVILNIIEMKTKYPDFDYNRICKALDKLVLNHDSTIVRHKAFLVSMYLRHPELFVVPENIDFENPNACFKTMASEFGNKLFVEY